MCDTLFINITELNGLSIGLIWYEATDMIAVMQCKMVQSYGYDQKSTPERDYRSVCYKADRYPTSEDYGSANCKSGQTEKVDRYDICDFSLPR